MTENHVVRKATLADLPVLVALMKDFYAEADYVLDQEQARRSFTDLLSQGSLGSVWIASNGGRAVGHAVLTVRYTMEHGGLSGYVDDLFVRIGSRRGGVASKLLHELEQDCLARECKALVVEVGKDNPAGLRTYEKLGMRPVNDGRVIYRKALTEGTA